MREFYFDEKELKCEKDEMRKLASDKKQQYVSKLQVVRMDFCAPLADCLPSYHTIPVNGLRRNAIHILGMTAKTIHYPKVLFTQHI